MLSKRIIEKYERALDDFLDSTAKRFRYDNRITFALRASFPGPWQEEGMAFAVWMDATNFYAFALIDKVNRGEEAPMSVEEFVSRLEPFSLEVAGS